METFLEIQLDHLDHNLKELRKHVGSSRIMAVLKANAYGHNAKEIMKALLRTGVDFFAVATIYEAMELRKVDTTANIMVLGYVAPENMAFVLENNFIINVFSEEYWQCVKTQIEQNSQKLRVHIKVDTGLHRLGFDISEKSIFAIGEIVKHPLVSAEGIYTHLSLTGLKEDREQFDRFMDIVGRLEQKGVSFPCRHLADSIATVQYPWAHLDMVRLGAVLYGLKTDHPAYNELDLLPTLKMYATISQIRAIDKGEGVSYNYTFVADRPMKIGTLTFGYADGYPKILNQKGYVLIHGKKAPFVGLMCMDQCMVDLTGIDEAKIHDKVLVFDIDTNSEVSLAQLSQLGETNKNNIIGALSKRIPRIYVRENETYYINELLGVSCAVR